jgi:RHS repeat-associated protein
MPRIYPTTNYLLVLLLSAAGPLSAQNTPSNTTRPAATAASAPVYTGSTVNYIRTWEPSTPLTDPAAVTATTDINSVKQTTQYFDGLGRPLQVVSRAISAGNKDLVSPLVYDAFGREQYKYLPYVQQGTNASDGKFKADPFNSQKSFYQSSVLSPGAAGETIYYSQAEFEASPLNRVLKTYSPGNSWAKEGGNRPVDRQYLVNTAADAVRIWDAPATGLPVSGAGRVYPAGTLYKTVVKDEQGNLTVEFRDKEEKLILKKTALTATADGYDGWLCTYYIYDDIGNLRFIIPPKAVELIKSSWALTQAIADELCFQYQYDSRNRMITKRLPGVLYPTEMVYDVRDRLVFIRDGNLQAQATRQWLVTFYDGLNRAIMTALYTSSATRDALQTSMNSATANTQQISYTFPGIADLVVANYDAATSLYQATNSITFREGFESAAGAELTAEVNSSFNQGSTIITATNPLPNIPASALTPLAYTFYDNYDFTGARPALTGDLGLPQAVNDPQLGSPPFPEALTGVSKMTEGLVTGTRVKVLGTTDQWLTSTIYYNDRGRSIQTITDNVSGGQDVSTSLYDFNGKLLCNYLRHKNLRSGSILQTTMRTTLYYDHAGRLKAIRKKLNDNSAYERTIAINSYDELGQLQTKRLGITAGSQWETLNYEYNIQGRLKSINKTFVNTAGSVSNWFGEELSYDHGFKNNQFNGNIAGAKWRTRNNVARAYGYTYDNSNRLKLADFSQLSGSTDWPQSPMDFSVSNLNYDANGNITSMTRQGMTGAAKGPVDQLTYRYKNTNNSNRLAAVSDPFSNSSARLGDFIDGANTVDDYEYDANGNLTKDLNKQISVISYNHLNLPENITVDGKGSIKFQYDAAGNKLKKSVTDNTVSPARTIVTDYINGYVYRNDTLQYLSHEEGRIRTKFQSGAPVSYVYDYFVRDHQDNVRMVLTEQTDFSIYTATMEAGSAAKETALFSNVAETRAPRPAGYPAEPLSPDTKNEYVAKLNAKEGGKKIGPSLVLKVMGGDTVQIGVRSFYKSTGPAGDKSATPEDMVASLIQAFAGNASEEGAHGANRASRTSPLGNFTGNDYQRLKEKGADQRQAGNPRAYLNFVLFDDQFNLVEDNSGVKQVKGTPDELQTLAVDKMPIKKSGFLYVYTSNETAQDVTFDNLTVMAISGPLLEETHYYPFGLTMAGISSNALKGTNYMENRMKYNSKELQQQEFGDGTGLEWYDYGARMYDHQIGRFFTQDRFTEKYPALNPYQYGANNPIKNIDLNGDSVIVSTSITGNKLLNSTFNAFAGTKAGRAFLANYAAKGQTIGGYTFEEDGKYSKKGVDLTYNAAALDDGENGSTHTSVKENGRAAIDVTINSEFEQTNQTTSRQLIGQMMDKAITLFHESTIHADLHTKDFLDDKNFNYSNISNDVKNIRGLSRNMFQHYQVLMDFQNKGYNSSNLFPGKAFEGIKQMNNGLKVYSSDGQIIQRMWDYNGGVELDENGNQRK